MKPEKFITMSSLGKNGRFGNQFFQYIFLKCLAKENNYSIEIPAWAGREIFKSDEVDISQKLPRVYELSNDINNSFLLNLNCKIFNCDLWGWFQFHTSYYRPYRDYIQEKFIPVESFLNEGSLILQQLLQKGKTIVSIHMRRGDANFVGPYYYAPSGWYLNWLQSIWSDLEDPVLYIASDEPDKVLHDFEEYTPYHLADFSDSKNDLSYYFDFFILQNSRMLAISNSTFSFAASMLNENCNHFFRPCKQSGQLVQFDPWDSDPIIQNRYEPNASLADEINNLFVKEENVLSNRKDFKVLRRKMIDIWLATSEYELEPLFQSKFGIAYRMFLHSGLNGMQKDTEELAIKSELLKKVNSGMEKIWFTQYLLAVMLLCEPIEFTFSNNIAAFPQWVLADYIKFLQRASDQDVIY